MHVCHSAHEVIGQSWVCILTFHLDGVSCSPSCRPKNSWVFLVLPPTLPWEHWACTLPGLVLRGSRDSNSGPQASWQTCTYLVISIRKTLVSGCFFCPVARRSPFLSSFPFEQSSHDAPVQQCSIHLRVLALAGDPLTSSPPPLPTPSRNQKWPWFLSTGSRVGAGSWTVLEAGSERTSKQAWLLMYTNTIPTEDFSQLSSDGCNQALLTRGQPEVPINLRGPQAEGRSRWVLSQIILLLIP